MTETDRPAQPRRLGLVTSQHHAALTKGDQLLQQELLLRKQAAIPVVWNAPEMARVGKLLDAVVIRSAWDYHQDLDAFVAWLEQVEADGALVVNPLQLVRWNADKRYLLELRDAGVPTVRSHLTKRGTVPDLQAVMDTYGWTDAVVKPRVSATADRTWRVDRTGVDPVQKSVNRAHNPSTGWIVQPFVDAILTRGEWSLVYLGGHYSHAVIKHAGHSDYRVQTEHGGRLKVKSPPDSVRAVSDEAVRAVATAWAYLRVDLVDTEEGPLVMEVEAIEPELFLEAVEGAPARAAGAIVAFLNAR